MTRNRFHALRMVWLSIKQVLGLRSDRDRYAVWSAKDEPVYAHPVHRFPAETPASIAGYGTPLEALARLIAVWSKRYSERPLSDAPIVSVVIPAHNHADVTVRCLQSIADSWFENMLVQIIFIDDASSDGTPHILKQLPGLLYLRNHENLGFLRSCNRAAQAAKGRYICFLNNDTTVRAGWLERLVLRAESDSTIGVVGAKLVYPDGKLQEAGGIIWNDGTGWNYGRNGDPSDARYNYLRDVDYCSGAALLVRASLLRQLACFDPTFAPAYYEDVDLCFGARSLGYRVVYEPRSEVTHFEGISSGTDVGSGTKQYQLLNLPKFYEKWRVQLANHMPPDAQNICLAARRTRKKRTILVVDEYVPLYDREAGSLRLLRVIKLLLELDYHVIFLPENYAPLQPYTSELQAMGIEVLYHTENGRTMDAALDEVLPIVDVAWISRANLFEKYVNRVRRNGRVAVIFDTVDLHFVRMKREADLFGKDSASWKSVERREIAVAKSADATVAVTPEEAKVLETAGVENVWVIPTIHEIEISGQRRFSESNGILFIGGYNHPPNRDAAQWLCREVMPIVWQHIPDAHVTLLGSSPSPDVLALQSDHVSVLGYVRDVAPHFLSNRVFAAALRFGAGHKGKVGQSLAFGLPLVTTAVGAEGFGLTDGVNCLVAERTEEFAAAIIRLYEDAALWGMLSEHSIEAVRPFTAIVLKSSLAALFERFYVLSHV